MSVVTISTLGDLENLLEEQEHNHYQLDRIHIIIINLDDVSMARLKMGRNALVKKIRQQSYLQGVAVIFSERNGKRSLMSSTCKLPKVT